jgi:hypothetical protein
LSWSGEAGHCGSAPARGKRSKEREECRVDGRSGEAVGSVQQSMKASFALTLLIMAMVAYSAEVDSATPVGRVVEGVYFQRNMYQKTLMELNDGKYRFWFSSDARMRGELTQYPLVGEYATNGGEIIFITTNTYPGGGLNTGNVTTNVDSAKAQTNVFHFLRTNRWTFMNYKGQTTLWRADGVKLWEQTGKASSYTVAFPVQKKPEDIWSGD